MSLIQIDLVDKTNEIDPELIQAVAAALTIQVTRDLPQFWNVQATVTYEPNAKKIPPGVWPVFLVKSLPPGEGGFHMDKHNQPYAKVIASPASDEWTIDASHETLEMLVDPNGTRLQPSAAIKIENGKIVDDGTDQFAYLVEACDPCEADNYAYPIQGVAVSDFLTPHFYDPIVTTGTRYSFTGAIKAPRQILPGGYISWVNQKTDELQQLLWVDTSEPPEIVNLGSASGLSLREWVDNHMAEAMGKTTVRANRHSLNEGLLAHCKAKRMSLDSISRTRAKLYDDLKHRTADVKQRWLRPNERRNVVGPAVVFSTAGPLSFWGQLRPSEGVAFIGLRKTRLHDSATRWDGKSNAEPGTGCGNDSRWT